MAEDKFLDIIQKLQKGEQPVTDVDNTNNQGLNSTSGTGKSSFGLNIVNEGFGEESEG